MRMSTALAVAPIFCTLVFCHHARAASVRHYVNQNYNFCIDYPSGWRSVVPFDGNAVELLPPKAQAKGPRTQITVGGQANQPSEGDDTRRQSLEEYWNVQLRAMAEYDKATAIDVIGKKLVTLAGYPALETVFEYTIGSERWHERQIALITQSDAVFVLSLWCYPNDVQQLRPIYDSVVRSFRIHCNPKLPERP